LSKKKKKSNNRRQPIEAHNTAAWANIERHQPVSNVSIPSDFEVINAKEYVDENRK